MRMRMLVLLGVVALAGCGYGPVEFSLLSPQYVPCGGTMCVQGAKSRPSRDPRDIPFMSDDTVVKHVNVPLKGLNAKDFRLLPHGWATDGVQVWCGRPEPEGKLGDLRSLGSNLYSIGTSVRVGCTPLLRDNGRTPVAAKGFEFLGCGLVRINGQLHSLDLWNVYPVAIADGPSFVMESKCRAHDARFGYRIEDGQLRDIHPRDKAMPQLSCGYLLIDGAVYFQNLPIQNADVATFEVLRTPSCNPPMARDANLVYQRSGVIQGADPASFEIIGSVGDSPDDKILSRDGSSVYLSVWRLKNADPATITVLEPRVMCNKRASGRYMKDSRQAYFQTQIIPNADPATFELVEPPLSSPPGQCSTGWYARDAKTVWYAGVRVEGGADAATFTVPSYGAARDRHREYRQSQPSSRLR